MKFFWSIIFCILISQTSFGDSTDTSSVPSSPVAASSKALQQYQPVATLMKNSEKWIWSQAHSAGVNKEVVVPIAAIASPIISHRLSTKAINMGWSPEKDLTIRPDIDYSFSTGEKKATFSLCWRF